MDGIVIRDASLEISPTGLEAMVNQRGAEVKVTRLDVALSQQALNTLLKRFAPAEGTPPSVEVGEGRLQVEGSAAGGRVALDLRVGTLRLEMSAEGLRVVSGPPAATASE